MTIPGTKLRTLPWALALASLYWTDAALTIWALQHGASELNLLATALMGIAGLWSLLALKAVATACLFLALWRVRPKIIIPWLKGATAFYILIVGWNLNQIIG